MVLTGRTALLAAVGAGVVAVLAGLDVPAGGALIAVNGVLALLVLVDFLRAARPADLALSRSGDGRVRLGGTARTHLQVQNAGRHRWRGTLRDAWTPTAGATFRATGADRIDLDLAPGESTRLAVDVHPARRGDRPTDRVTVRSRGPMGLAGRQRSSRVDWSVRTLPPFASRRHLPSRLARLRDMEGRQAIAVRAEGTEFDSLREYVPGDDVRSIDWRATARATDVMVRTWRPERDRQVVLVMDTGRTCAARVGDETRLDVLIDAALLLAALAARAGDRVDLLAHDRRTRVRAGGGSGPSLLPRLVDGIADLEPELVETDHRGLVAAAAAGARKRSLVVLFTALDRAPLEEGLLPALPVLTARHTVIVVAVREPRDAAAPDAEGAYARAAQARADLDRAHMSRRLAQLGVHLVDAEPDRVAPRLADAYLDLKAAGRL